MRKSTLWFGAAVLAFAAAVTSPAFALELGEKAPELEVTGWAQGAPIKLADGAGKSVFVVEFVSTFKPECAPAMEEATKLQDKYKAKGLEVIVISTETADEVKKYLAEHKQSFRFAVDEDRNTTGTYQGERAYEPFAVVVDKSGCVAFLGDPSRGMAKIVDDVIAGKFNLQRAVDVQKLKQDLWAALRAHDADKATSICDKILELDPGDQVAYDRRCDAFEQKDDLDAFKKFVKAHLDRVKDDPKMLSYVAIKLVDLGKVNWRDPETAVVSARRAADLAKGADADILDTYAYVLGEIGLVELALEQAKKAVALAPADESYKTRQKYFESCLALKQKVAPAAPPKKK